MAQSTHTFRIFVSSTFSDLQAERDTLQEKVLPRLRDLVRGIPPILAWSGVCNPTIKQLTQKEA